MSATQVIHSYRATHSFPGALYLLPSDNEEKTRQVLSLFFINTFPNLGQA